MEPKRGIDSLVCAPSAVTGGVKSLFMVCEALATLGRSRIALYAGDALPTWFQHGCQLYDRSYVPNALIYPEVFQPRITQSRHHICYALGKYGLIEPHASLVVCKSLEVFVWVKQQHPQIPATIIKAGINRSVFEYDGRPKQDLICYMTRPQKHPETAQMLRDRYGAAVVEIRDRTEAEVADMLKSAKVFVWRGNDQEGSPRPPKEALVAGCNVVGLAADLNERYQTNFGIHCASVGELLEMAGQALQLPVPSMEQRSRVRDHAAERQAWVELVQHLVNQESQDGRSPG